MKQLFQKFKGHVLTALVCLVLGMLLGFILDKPKTEFLAGEVIIKTRDTCELNRLIADVITETTTKESGGIRKGKPQKESSTLPIVETSKQDSTYTTVFSKSYNTGLMRMKVTTTVKAKSVATGKIDMEYELDTLELAKLTTIVNTVVVQKDSTDKVPDQIVRFLPVEGTKSKGAYLGLSGGALYTNKVSYQAGVNITGERLGLTLYTTPTPKEWKHFGVQLNTKLVKLKK